MGRLFSFKGRLGRQAYWLTVLAGIVLYAMFVAWQATRDPWTMPQVYTTYSGGTEVYWGTGGTLFVYGLFMTAGLLLSIIGLSVSVRRWHDLGKSGWWVFISLVPIVGGLYAFIMQGFMPGESGPNPYDAGSPIRATRQQSARQHDVLQALPAATMLSFVGTTITILAVLDIATDRMWLRSYDDGFFYSYLVLTVVTTVLAWLAGSYYASDLVHRLGFRQVSIIADTVTGLFLVVAILWSPPFLLLLIVVFFALALRIAAHTAYRAMMPDIIARIRVPFMRVNALLDSFPYVAFLIVPLLVVAIERAFRYRNQIEWLYVLFVTFSALFVAFAIPSLRMSETSPAVPDSMEPLRMDAGITLAEDAVDWS